MHTLLLRLAGPMQSWGTQSRFTTRDTGQEPSKSGVIGLLCAALGRTRHELVDDLAQLEFGVRVERAGIVKRDFHTVMDVARSSGRIRKNPVVTERYYLADADFLVGLGGENLDVLRALEHALRDPVWPIFLGRKSFIPSLPIALPWRNGAPGGVRAGKDLLSSLVEEPQRDLTGAASGMAPAGTRLVLERDDPDRAERRFDQPAPGVPFSERRFLPRYVETMFLPIGTNTSTEVENG